MRKIQIVAFLFLIVAYATSGKGLAKTYSCQDILEQGKLLSRLERASWVSTDIMMQEHKDKAENIKGYFSYPLEDHIFTCFYSKEEPFKIILKFQYNATLDKLSEPVSIDIGKGNPSTVEEGLIILREEAIKCVVEDKKGFFNYFPNSSFNFIPLLGANEHKVYIITASSNNSQEILLGNDYLLRYGLDFKLIEKKKASQFSS